MNRTPLGRFFTATALIREVKELASQRSELRRKSFHHLLSKGCIAHEGWQCLRDLCGYLQDHVCFAEWQIPMPINDADQSVDREVQRAASRWARAKVIDERRTIPVASMVP